MFMAKGTPRTAWPCRYVTLFYGCLDADCFLDVLCGLIIAGSSGKVLFTHLLRKYMQLDFKNQIQCALIIRFASDLLEDLT